MRAIWVASSIAIALLGCAQAINRHNAARYYDRGLEAAASEDNEAAEEAFARALVNACIGNAPKAGISAAAYNLGKTKATLCKLEEAKALMEEALILEDHSRVLTAAGFQTEAAAAAAAEARRLRASNPNRDAGFTPENYRNACKQKP